MSTNNFEKFLNIDDEHKKKQSKKNLTVKKESGLNLKIEGKEKIINNAIIKDLNNVKDRVVKEDIGTNEDRGRKRDVNDYKDNENKEKGIDKNKSPKNTNTRGKSVDAFTQTPDYFLNNLSNQIPIDKEKDKIKSKKMNIVINSDLGTNLQNKNNKIEEVEIDLKKLTVFPINEKKRLSNSDLHSVSDKNTNNIKSSSKITDIVNNSKINKGSKRIKESSNEESISLIESIRENNEEKYDDGNEDIKQNVQVNAADNLEDFYEFKNNFELINSNNTGIEEKLSENKLTNQFELNLQGRIVSNFISSDDSSSIPKFAKTNPQDRKFKEIMNFSRATSNMENYNFYDECILFGLRKKIDYVLGKISDLFKFIIDNVYAENFIILVILANLIISLISDPNNEDSIQNKTEIYFLIFYTIEAVFKMSAFTLNGYFHDPWCLFDFFVVFIGWIITLLAEVTTINTQIFGSLRSFRTLRPLKTVKSFPKLRVLMETLVESLSGLKDILIILFFFILILGVTGNQMFLGNFKKQCGSLDNGVFLRMNPSYSNFCTYDSDCNIFNDDNNVFSCIKNVVNPFDDLTIFDNTIKSMCAVFVIMTLEGWSDFMILLNNTFRDTIYVNRVIVFLYFFIIIFAGSYYLLNLFLAVIKAKYAEMEFEQKKKTEIKYVKLIDLLNNRKRKIAKDNKKNKNVENNEESDILKLKSSYTFIDKDPTIFTVNFNNLKNLLINKLKKPKERKEFLRKIIQEKESIENDFQSKELEIRKNYIELDKEPEIDEKLDNENDNLISIETEKNNKRIRNAEVRNQIKEEENVNKAFEQKILEECINLALSKLTTYIKEKKNKIDEQFLVDNDDNKDISNDLINLNDIAILSSDDSIISNAKEDVNEIANKILLNFINLTGKKNLKKSSKDLNKIVDKKINLKDILLKKMDEREEEEFKKALDYDKIKDMSESDVSLSLLSENDDKNLLNSQNLKKNIDKIFSQENMRKIFLEDKTINISNLNNDNINSNNDIIKPLKIIKDKIKSDNAETNSILTINVPTVNFSKLEKISKIKYDEDKSKFETKNESKNNNIKNSILKLDDNNNNKYQKKNSYLDILKYTDNKTNKNDLIREINEYEEELNNKNSLNVSIVDDHNLFVDKNQNFLKTSNPTINFKHELVSQDLLNQLFDEEKLIEKDKKGSNKMRSFFAKNEATVLKEINDSTNNISTNKNKSLFQSKKRESHLSIINRTHDQEKRFSVEKNFYKLNNSSEIIYKSSETGTVPQYYKDIKNKVPNYLKHTISFLNYSHNVEENFVIQNPKVVEESEIYAVITKKEHEEVEIEKNLKNELVYFNPSTVNIITENYIRYEYEDYDTDLIMSISNNLKDLSNNIYDIMPKVDLNSKRDNSKAFSLWTSKRSTTRSDPESFDKKKSFLDFLNPSTKTKSLNKNTEKINLDISRYVNMKHKVRQLNRVLENIEYSKLQNNFLDEKNLIVKDKEREYDEDDPDLMLPIYEIDMKTEINKIREYDSKTNTLNYIVWSTQEVLELEDNKDEHKNWNDEIDKLENINIILWNQKPGFTELQIINYYFYKFCNHVYFESFIMVVVIINAIYMSLQGNLLSKSLLDSLSTAEIVFSGIFFFEFFIKFFGLGPILYFSEGLNYIDCLIVCLSLVDLATANNPNIDVSNLAFLRVLRIFRVLRLVKVLKKNKSIKKLIIGISEALSNVTYIMIILFMFIIIFILLGNSINGKDEYYDDFLNTFYQTYELLVLEDWNSKLYRLNSLGIVSVIYVLIWVFFGNFFLFNIFLSILLDSFNFNEDEIVIYPKNYPETFRAIEEAKSKQTLKLKEEMKQKIKNSLNNDYSSEEEEEEYNLEELNNATTYTDTDTFVIQAQEKRKKKYLEKLVRRNECEKALYFLRLKNPIRLFLIKVINDKRFDNFIIYVILFGTFKLVIQSFIREDGSDNVKSLFFIFDLIDLAFNVIFIFECSLKVLANGFVMDKGTYLRDSWNKLDFFIVCISAFDFQSFILTYFTSGSSTNLSFLKVLRMLRVLRPLRFISKNVQLKIMINSLLNSLTSIVNLLFVVFVVFYVFAIMGINLFSDIEYTCYIDEIPNKDNLFSNKTTTLNLRLTNTTTDFLNTCYELNGNMHLVPKVKYSNIIDGIISSYILATVEGYPGISRKYETYGLIYGLFYFLNVLVSSNFMLNLFIGVIMSSYSESIKKENENEITNNIPAKLYLNYLSQLEEVEPDYEVYKKINDKMQLIFTKIVTHKFFDNFILSIIILNMFSMAVEYDTSSDEFTQVLKYINYVFSSIFLSECIFKLIAYRSLYFYQGWNQFDFFVVCASIIDICLDIFLGTNLSFLKSLQILRVLRVLRVTR